MKRARYITIVFIMIGVYVTPVADARVSKDVVQVNIESTAKVSGAPESIPAESAAAMVTTTSSVAFPTYTAVTSVDVDPTTGSATLSIPISMPQGRAGIQPSIALTYNSNIKNGIVGVGWSLDFGVIQRSTKRGVPRYDGSDAFVLVQSGSRQNLVYDAAAGFYRTEIEGAFMKTEKNGDTWIVTDKKGVKYYFGETSAGRIYADPLNIFSWYLERVEDVHGNYMTIAYEKDANQMYPLAIEYTGNSDTAEIPFARVDFVKEERDDPVTSAMSGVFATTQYRISEISVSVDGNLQTRYALGYTESAATHRSLLTSVTQYGNDDATTLPATTFAYQDATGFEEVPDWNIPASSVFADYANGRYADMGTRIVDVDADGYSDLVRHYHDCSEVLYQETYINDHETGWYAGAGALYEVPSNLPGYIRRCPEFDRDRGIRFADLNNDGWMDVIRHYKRDPHWGGDFYNEAYINDQLDSFDRDPAWDMPYDTAIVHERGQPVYDYSEDMGTRFIDVNNDGYVDVVRSKEGDFQPMHWTFLSNAPTGGTGWSRVTSWDPPLSSQTDLANGAAFADVNGDGLPDIVYMKSGTRLVYLNNGHNWTLDTSDTWRPSYGNLSDGTTQLADINGDGLVDVYVGAGGSGVHPLINTGNGWIEDTSWVMPLCNFETRAYRFADADGDGMLDIVYHLLNADAVLHRNIGTSADLLSSVNNGIGAITTIGYDSSANYENTFLPFALQVVKSVRVDDSLGHVYTTEHSYADGLWSAREREFRGFGYAKTTDVEGNYSETWFLQDDILKGRIEKQETRISW